MKGYPEATLYELDANADAALRLYWRVNDEILLPVDEGRTPKAGNAGWGYMLSRNAAPYGPPS